MVSATVSKSKGLYVTPFGGAFFLMFLEAAAVFGVTFYMTPAIPLLWISPNLYRKWMRFVGKLWMDAPVAILELLFGVKYVFSGSDQLDKSDGLLVLCNHRNRLDWLFLWGFFHRFGQMENEKIVLKAPLRNFPGPGWAVQHLCFLFLERKWEIDHDHMDRWLKYHESIDDNIQLLLFPEGTDLNGAALTRSHAYSDKTGLPKYQYVMHPRVKGFWFTLDNLRKHIDSLYDLTIAYPLGIAETETDLLWGYFPAEIHVDCQKYKRSDLPTEEVAAGDWCKALWSKKEIKLKELYERSETDIANGQPITGFENRHKSPPNITTSLSFCLAFWTATISGGVYCMATSNYARAYFVASTIGYIVANKIGVNWDTVEVNTGLGMIESGSESVKKKN